jgi:signal transduction histidine kinase
MKPGFLRRSIWHVQGLVERSDVEITVDIGEDFGRLPRDMELVVFRLVQECLTNIHRHSGSKTASIRVAREDDRVTVEVRDQGIGMTDKDWRRFSPEDPGWGFGECANVCANSKVSSASNRTLQVRKSM